MLLENIKNKIPEKLFSILKQEGINELMPCQIKSINAGLFDGKNLLVCTPTASGKTLIAELIAVKTIIEKKKKAVYIVPLKALASEKFKEFKRRYGSMLNIALSIGDFDSAASYLTDYDLIIATSEKLDSLIRHNADWINEIGVVIVDEIHLMADISRGPTLEILITILRELLRNVQIIALSATIGNPEELAEWMNANLVLDEWRPVKLYKGVYFNGEVNFED